MPIFREVLKNLIPSKTERLIRHIKGVTAQGLENISRRRQQVLNFLRDNQRITGFAQPKSFSITDYQTRTQKYFNSLIGGISRFIRTTSERLQRAASTVIMTPSARMYKQALNRVIERSRAAMIDLARDLIDNKITIREFRDGLGKQIRQVHTAAAFIGLRSITNATGNTLEVLQARISKQLNFADDFTRDIQDVFDKQQEFTAKQAERIINSASKYASAAKSTANDLERQLLIDTYGDNVEEDRILAMRLLGGNENHCMSCPSLAGYWVELDELVPIGDTPCTTSCYCSVIYSRASDVAGETLMTDTASDIL